MMAEAVIAGKVLFAWSGGKDSALALHELLKTGGIEVRALLTTLSEGDARVAMHGIPCALLERQSEALGYPLEKVFVPANVTDEEYGRVMSCVLEKYLAEGVSSVVFGDVFLEGVRKRRELNLRKVGMKALFPLWGRGTMELARSFIGSGFKAVLTCVDAEFLDKGFVGREFDGRFIAELPPDVDPCGENGEFHTFVYGGPLFRNRVRFRGGDVVVKNRRFHFQNLSQDESLGCYRPAS